MMMITVTCSNQTKGHNVIIITLYKRSYQRLQRGKNLIEKVARIWRGTITAVFITSNVITKRVVVVDNNE